MKQFIFCTHDLKLKTAVLTNEAVRHFDCVVPQKTTINIPLNYLIENNDIVIIRDQNTNLTEFIGVIDTVSHEENTTVLIYPFEGIFDNECILTELDGSIYDWIVANVSANFIETGDDLNDYPIIFENHLLSDLTYKRIIESNNLLDNLNDIFLNTGVYIRFSIGYNSNGNPYRIIIGVYNANEEENITIRYDNPIIVDSKVLIERSNAGSFNKAIIQIYSSEKQLEDIVKLYLKENNTLTSNPEDSERIKQVKTKIIDYTPSEDEITAEQQGEAIILLAEKALCGNAFNHSIEFTVVTNKSYNWRPNKRCDFVAEDRIYYTYVTSVEYLSDRHAKVQLGAYRYTLTDRFKAFRKKEVDATSIKGLTVTKYFWDSMIWFTQDEDGHLILNYPSTLSEDDLRSFFSIEADEHLWITCSAEDEAEYRRRYKLDSNGKLIYNL